VNELHEQIAREAARIAENELEPRAAEVDEGAAKVAVAPLAELGLVAPDLPSDLGGADADPVARSIVLEVLSGTCASTGLAVGIQGLAAHAAFRHGNADLVRRFALAEETVALAFSEGRGGEDSEIVTVVEGGRVRGAKNVLGPARAGALLVLAKDALVLVDTSAAVIETTALRTGLRGLPPRTALLDAPAVVLGGAVEAERARAEARALVAPVATGLVARALEEARRYAMMRQQFGRPIARFQGVQFLVAQIHEAREGCRALARAAALAMGRGELPSLIAASCALEAPARAVKAALDCVQVFGGTGYTREVVAERLLRDALALQGLAGAAGAGSERTIAAARLA
jgi:acyl-CoA dehydrogenase